MHAICKHPLGNHNAMLLDITSRTKDISRKKKKDIVAFQHVNRMDLMKWLLGIEMNLK
jgi:hypothetical protein